MTENNLPLELPVMTGSAIVFGVTYIVRMRMISMLEENQIRQRFTDLASEQDPAARYKKEFEINCDVISELSDKVMTVRKADQPEAQHLPVRDFLGVQNPLTERVAEHLMRGYLTSLAPDISFK